MKRIKEFMIKMMNELNKVYAKLFKNCLTTKEAKAKAKPRKKYVNKKKSTTKSS